MRSKQDGDDTIDQHRLAALKQLALDGGLAGETYLGRGAFSNRLGVSTRTVERWLRELEETDYISRRVVEDGQHVTLTERGVNTLRREYHDYRSVLEPQRGCSMTGTVVDGEGEGRHYISLPGYRSQFEERLGYEPYPGTLNVDLGPDASRDRDDLEGRECTPIDAWEDGERTYGGATCYTVEVSAHGGSVTSAHILVPHRTHHDEGIMEVIAPVELRGALALETGDEVRLDVS